MGEAKKTRRLWIVHAISQFVRINVEEDRIDSFLSLRKTSDGINGNRIKNFHKKNKR